LYQEEFDDTKGVIRIRKSKNRQYDGQMIKNRQYDGQMIKNRQYDGQMIKNRQYDGQMKKGQKDKQPSTTHYTKTID